MRRELVGSMAVLNTFERAADLFATGAIDAKRIITDRVPLSGYASAIDQFRNGSGGRFQVVP